MKYSDYTKLLSEARMSKYIKACGGDKVKAIRLYHYNIKLSERMFAVINMFEIILRNAIDQHYRVYFSDPRKEPDAKRRAARQRGGWGGAPMNIGSRGQFIDPLHFPIYQMFRLLSKKFKEYITDTLATDLWRKSKKMTIPLSRVPKEIILMEIDRGIDLTRVPLYTYHIVEKRPSLLSGLLMGILHIFWQYSLQIDLI